MFFVTEVNIYLRRGRQSKSMFGDTYSMGLVKDFLDDKGIPFKYNNANAGMLFYNHGCRVQLNDTFSISIQTHPDVAGPCFAETALQNTETKRIVDDGTFGYYDVQRWCTPDDLFEHITKVFKELV